MNIYAVILVIDNIIIIASSIAAYIKYQSNSKTVKGHVNIATITHSNPTIITDLQMAMLKTNQQIAGWDDTANSLRELQNHLFTQGENIAKVVSELQNHQDRFEIQLQNQQGQLTELQNHQDQLTERDNILDSSLAELESSFNTKSRSQFVVAPEHVICSGCTLAVARYYLKGGSPVCANCDPQG